MGELGSTRWASTVTTGPFFHAPFGNRMRAAAQLAELDYFALPQDYKNASAIFAQEDIPAGQVPGVTYKIILYSYGALPSQSSLDDLIRSQLYALGYDVSASSVANYNVKYAWRKSPDGTYDALQIEGPAEMQNELLASSSTPDALPNYAVARTYAVTLRPQDLSLTPERIQELVTASRAIRSKITEAGRTPTGEVHSKLVLRVHGVPAPSPKVEPIPVPAQEPKPLTAGYAGWLALAGLGTWLLTRKDLKKRGAL
jgi:hypothetical protein